MKPSRSTLPSSSLLVATVVPWQTAVMSSPVASSTPRIFSMPAMKPSAGLAGVLGVLVVTSSPVSSSNGDDVGEGAAGVDADPDPPLSVRHAVDSTGRSEWIRRQFVPTGRRSPGQPRHPAEPVQSGTGVDSEHRGDGLQGVVGARHPSRCRARAGGCRHAGVRTRPRHRVRGRGGRATVVGCSATRRPTSGSWGGGACGSHRCSSTRSGCRTRSGCSTSAPARAT